LKIFDLKFNSKEIKFFKKNVDNIFKAVFFSNHHYVKIFEENFKKHYMFKCGRYSLGIQKPTVGRRVNKSRVCYDTNGRPCVSTSKGSVKCYKGVE
jgi:hypothetical protein